MILMMSRTAMPPPYQETHLLLMTYVAFFFQAWADSYSLLI
jgi:hypothetical protein